MRTGEGSALQDLQMNNGLTVVTPGRGGIMPELEDWERGVTVVDENGNPVMETVANPNIATAWPDAIE